jgi:hypothetical protein
MNISEATRRALSKFPYLEDYMSQGMINHRALARAILPEIKKELERDVNLQSIVTAVRRYPVSRRRKGGGEIQKILSQSSVILKYDVGAITIQLGKGLEKSLGELRKVNEKFIVIQGIETLTVIGDERILSTFDVIVKDSILDRNQGLASVVIISPKVIAETCGVIAYLASSLALDEINVVEMMSSYNETVFIVEEEDALKTIGKVRGEIKRARG